jgi:ribosomal protein S18 acetylase RimI-like enzyme
VKVSDCAVQLVAIEPIDRGEFMRVAEQHFRGLSSTFTPHDDWKRNYFETILANPQLFLRWILSSGERSGFILYGLEAHRFLPRKTGAIYELYINPENRRHGLARQAAQIAIRELLVQGPSKIQLEVVEGNAGAAALWTSLGFEKVTERYVLSAKL